MPANDLALLTDAALAAGQIAKRFFRQDPKRWDKGDGQGPVTEADLAVDAMLRDRLIGTRAHYGWMSEESHDDSRTAAERVFIVDPIDGTRSFIEGSDTFAHSLAVARFGVVEAAVIHLPIKALTFAATRGGGATLNGVPIRVTDPVAVAGARVLGARVNLEPRFWPRGVPPVERHFRASLAYRLALVAAGEFDAMITLRPAWEWDIAAGCLILEEAGGRATGADGEPLAFNSPAMQTSGVIAAGPALHQGLVAARGAAISP